MGVPLVVGGPERNIPIRLKRSGQQFIEDADNLPMNSESGRNFDESSGSGSSEARVFIGVRLSWVNFL